jgi:ABC-2 type transport system permease protein
MSADDIDPRKHKLIGQQPLGIMVSGQFPDAFANMAPPKWPGDTTAISPAMETFEKRPTKLILYGCGEMFADQIIGAFSNGLLVLNSVDALALGDDLISVRSKMMTERYIKETSAATKMFWRFFSTILVPLALIAMGIIRFMMRRQRRETYQRLLEQAS